MGSYKRYREYFRYLTALEHNINILEEKKLRVKKEYKKSQNAGRIMMKIIVSNTRNLKELDPGSTPRDTIAKKKAKIQNLKTILREIVTRKMPKLKQSYLDLKWKLQDTEAQLQTVIHL